MDCISEKKLEESNYKKCGFYFGSQKITVENAFLFERHNDNFITVKQYMLSSDGAFIVNDCDGVGQYFESTLKGVEFKGFDQNGNLVNIESWILSNAIEINGASEFLGIE